MQLSGIRHQGKGITEKAPPGPKRVVNGVPAAAAPAPGDVLGVEVAVVNEIGVLVALVMAVEEVEVLEKLLLS